MQGLEEYSRTAEQTARDQLVVDHLWLVRHIVGKMAARFPPGVDVENLESAGMLGLVEASQRFDAGRGVDFKAFASIRIRGSVVDELRRSCPLPQEKLQQVGMVQRAKESLQPPVTVEALAAETGLSKDAILDCLAAIPLTQMKSLDNLGEAWFGSDRSDAPDAGLELEDQKRLLADGIEALPKRERLVVTLYYMEDLRLKEIGQVLNLSESRVSRLLTAAQHQLREYCRIRTS